MRTVRLLIAITILVGIAAAFFVGRNATPTAEESRAMFLAQPRPLLIAHGLGAIDGRTITNSREAFEENYRLGKRTFEADLAFTSDDTLVLFHEDTEQWHGWTKTVGQMTAAEFKRQLLWQTYPTLTFADLLSLMRNHKDAWLILDTKDNAQRVIAAALETVERVAPSVAPRIVPQVFAENDLLFVERETPFPAAIFALYRSALTPENVLDLLAQHPLLVGVSIPEQKFSEAFARALDERNVFALVHTINDPETIARYEEQGTTGFYTDMYRR